MADPTSPRLAVDEIYLTALEFPPGVEREACLERLCGADSALRRRVDQLLAARPLADSFLEAPAPGLDATSTIDGPRVVRPGSSIGPYKLLQEIGEGGMGVVYMAEQSQPVKRRVALKVIKPGMDTRHVIARFGAERQALALMDHPNIARVLDCGTTDHGLPYFVMELVHGTPITRYGDDRQLTTRQRLELFVPICHAVQHAHQKGIIHRDLKPSNILVAEYDQRPIPKIIDFGVAKALGSQLTERTMFTQYGQVVGTPEYMSPEQSRVNQLDIDTRSDIYSLGVLLYELLTGVTPFDRQRLRAAAFDEMLRIIREEDAPRPSTRLSTIDTLPSVAANRHTEPKKLTALLRGDLDWIVMKAIEKDRSRRYETAVGLAADLSRYLEGDAVSACPPTALYRIKKFAAKHRRMIGAAAALATLLMVIAIGAVIWGLHANTQRRKIDQVNSQLERTNQSLKSLSLTEQQSRRDAQERLRESLLVSARAGRFSGSMGRRFDGLQALQEAASIGPGPDIRNEAIACMSLVDLRIQRTWSIANRAHVGVSFDGDLHHAARVLEDGGLIVERVADQREMARLPSLQRWVNDGSLDLSADSRWLSLIYGESGELSLVVWDVESQTIRLEVPTSGFQNVDLREGGRLFAFRAPNGAVRVYDLIASEVRTEIVDHGLTDPCFFAFHPQRPLLAIATPTCDSVLIYDYVQKSPFCRVTLSGPGRYLAWSFDGSRLAVAVDREIEVHDLEAGRAVSTLKGHQALVCQLFYHPRRHLLFSNSWDNSLRVWDPLTGEQQLRARGMCRDLSADGTCLGVTGNFQASILEVAVGDERRVLRERIGMPGNHRDAQFDCSGRFLLTSSDYGVSLWDLAFDRLLAELNVGQAHEAAWLGDSPVFVTTGESGLWRWPLQFEGSSPTVRIGPPEYLGVASQHFVTTLAADHAGKTLFTCRLDQRGSLVVDAATGSVVRTLPRVFGNLAISGDGRWIACAQQFANGDITVRDAQTLRTLAFLPGSPGALVGIDFSPDGKKLVACDAERVRLFDTSNWALLWEQARSIGVGSNYHVHVSPDSYYLVILEEGVKVRLLELASGRELAVLECGADIVTDMTFSRDGSQLAVMGSGLTIHLWDLNVLRKGLSRFGLDWDGPDTPPAPDATAWRARGPLQVTLEYGEAERFSAESPLRMAALGITSQTVSARLAKNANDAEAIAWRGMIRRREGLMQSALDDFSQAISLDPALPLAFAERAKAYSAQGREELAIADYEQALALGYREPLLHNHLAWIYVAGPAELRKPARAIELARVAAELDPENPRVANTLGVALYRAGEFDAAARVLLQNAERLENERPVFDWLFAALSFHQLGQMSDAAKAWEKVLDLEPTIARQNAKTRADWKALRGEADSIFGAKAVQPPAQSP